MKITILFYNHNLSSTGGHKRHSLAYCARLSLNGLSPRHWIVIVDPIMSYLTFAPKLPHSSKIATLLESLQKSKEAKVLGITNYGYCEVEDNQVSHYRFSLPSHDSRSTESQIQSIVLPSFTYTLTGTDSWMPETATLTTVSRTTTSFEEGWEYRTEQTNGIKTEQWWVPSNKQQAFELFIKDNATK